MENILGTVAVVGIVVLLVVIALYVAVGILLNKLNKQINGKGTPMAWIPIANIYLLGKLTVNKIVGWVLVACMLLTSTYSTTINGVTTTHTILPESINSILSTIYSLAVIGLIIYAVVKYNQLKNNSGKDAAQPHPAQQATVQPQPAQQATIQPQPAQQATAQPQPAQQTTVQQKQNNNLQ